MWSGPKKIALSCALAALIGVGINWAIVFFHHGPAIHFTKPEAAMLVAKAGVLLFGLNTLILLAAYALMTKIWQSRVPLDLLLCVLIVLCGVLWGGSLQALAWGDPNAWALVTFALSALFTLIALRLPPAPARP